MAQSASLAEAKASQARQNLEKYVFGTAVSTVPPVVTPMLPSGVSSYPSYPYVNSPMQWTQGTPPISAMSLNDSVILLSVVTLSSQQSQRFAKLSSFI